MVWWCVGRDKNPVHPVRKGEGGGGVLTDQHKKTSNLSPAFASPGISCTEEGGMVFEALGLEVDEEEALLVGDCCKNSCNAASSASLMGMLCGRLCSIEVGWGSGQMDKK